MQHKICNFQSWIVHGLGNEIAFDGDRPPVFLDPEIGERLLNQFVRAAADLEDDMQFGKWRPLRDVDDAPLEHLGMMLRRAIPWSRLVWFEMIPRMRAKGSAPEKVRYGLDAFHARRMAERFAKSSFSGSAGCPAACLTSAPLTMFSCSASLRSSRSVIRSATAHRVLPARGVASSDSSKRSLTARSIGRAP
ncbi:hypothetical protein [Bradyrhizobium lablabi]|uniref:hypothetical protein n=1 Tax=Bradyrhizobium lablabi TaxID=722472 RepID=UPI0012E3F146|nr:hypothetical protein [Bradyrhizobium lablabi]